MTPSTRSQRLSRRRLLQGLVASPLLYRAAPLHGEWYRPLTPRTDAAAFTEARYTPNYPSRSPLEDVLRRVAPGSRPEASVGQNSDRVDQMNAEAAAQQLRAVRGYELYVVRL